MKKMRKDLIFGKKNVSLTLMRLLAAVDAAVGVEGAGGGEALAADVADVRLLAGVRPQVAPQQRRPVERLAAVLARQHGAFSGRLRARLRHRRRRPGRHRRRRRLRQRRQAQGRGGVVAAVAHRDVTVAAVAMVTVVAVQQDGVERLGRRPVARVSRQGAPGSRQRGGFVGEVERERRLDRVAAAARRPQRRRPRLHQRQVEGLVCERSEY